MQAVQPTASHYCSIPTCHKVTTNRCGGCKITFYCSAECQLKDWKAHKPLCKREIKVLPSSEQSVSSQIAIAKNSLDAKGLRQFKVMQDMLRDWNRQEVIPDYLKSVPETPESELLHLIIFLDEDESSGIKLYDKLGTVPGIRIIEKSNCVPTNPPKDCANYVFQKEEWYKNISRRQILFETYDRTLSFLRKQGYTPTPSPQVGDLIAYCTAYLRGGTHISHYGVVSKVVGSSIEIQSKWNHGHVFEHPFQIVPPLYGCGYTFLTLQKMPTENTAESKKESK